MIRDKTFGDLKVFVVIGRLFHKTKITIKFIASMGINYYTICISIDTLDMSIYVYI